MTQNETKNIKIIAQTLNSNNDDGISSNDNVNVPVLFTTDINNETFFEKSSIPHYCNICNYTTTRFNNFNKHLLTPKHKDNTIGINLPIQEYSKYECICGYECKSRSTLWRHKNKCNFNGNGTNNLIQELIKNTQEIIKENKELKQMVLDISKK